VEAGSWGPDSPLDPSVPQVALESLSCFGSIHYVIIF
jgi:hypothetical protein